MSGEQFDTPTEIMPLDADAVQIARVLDESLKEDLLPWGGSLALGSRGGAWVSVGLGEAGEFSLNVRGYAGADDTFYAMAEAKLRGIAALLRRWPDPECESDVDLERRVLERRLRGAARERSPRRAPSKRGPRHLTRLDARRGSAL